MARSEGTIEIARPPAQVFPWLVEPERRLRWVSGLAASVPLDERRYRETMEAAGRRVEVEATVVRLEEPRVVDVDMRGRGVSAHARSRLEPTATGTRVTSSLELELGGLLRFAGPIAARQAQHSLERSLRRLKELVEAEPEQPGAAADEAAPATPTDAAGPG